MEWLPLRSSHVQRKNYFKFRGTETPAGVSVPHFHRRGREGERHLQRRFLRKRGAAVSGLALSVFASQIHTPPFVAARHLPPARGKSFLKGRGLGMTGKFPAQVQSLRACPLPLGGAVAQRLRGSKSAEPEKTVKRSSRRTGVNLQFFPV